MQNSTNRRAFLRDGVLVLAGGASAALLPEAWRAIATTSADAAQDRVGPEKRLQQLGIELPPAPQPVAVYRPAVLSGIMLYASGHGPRQADGRLIQGKVGRDLTLEQGYAAAHTVGLNVLSTVRNTLGTLDRVVRLVKVLGMVNCTSEFAKQPQVINGFSELMVQVFGEQFGKAARSAVGMAALPSNIAVEIEAIFEVRV